MMHADSLPRTRDDSVTCLNRRLGKETKDLIVQEIRVIFVCDMDIVYNMLAFTKFTLAIFTLHRHC
jgi:hypothetical protein